MVWNMIYMKSINSSDGKLTIETTFEVGTDPDIMTVFTQIKFLQPQPNYLKMQKTRITTQNPCQTFYIATLFSKWNI